MGSYFYAEPKIIAMSGMPDSGKTTMMYMLKLGEVIRKKEEDGFCVEIVNYRQFQFIIWACDTKETNNKIYWRKYCENPSALIWVVSSAAKTLSWGIGDTKENALDRMDQSGKELHRLLSLDEFKHIPILIFANKQDIYNAFTVDEISKLLKLEDIPARNLWYIQSSCATTGDGLYEGLDWLSNTMKMPKTEYDAAVLGRINNRKSILLISGYIRSFDQEYNLKTPCALCQRIHTFYADQKFDTCKFYG